jgi:hypothetical protein
MSTSTSGPWTTYLNTSNDVVVRKMSTDGQELRMISRGSSYENARLIAAAPDLLEALKSLLAVAPSKAPAAGLIVGIEEKHKAAIADSRAAIAKAEGSQS